MLVKTIIRKRKELKKSIKEYWKTIYCNITLVGLILERYIGVKSIEAGLSKRNPSYSIVISVPDDHPITICLHNAYISSDDDRLVTRQDF